MQALGCLLFIAIFASQIVFGWSGALYLVGLVGTMIAIAVMCLTRWTWPLTIATFVGAWKVWALPWYVALAIALPGVALMLPVWGIIGFDALRRQLPTASRR